jgi:hypothetical protein
MIRFHDYELNTRINHFKNDSALTQIEHCHDSLVEVMLMATLPKYS